MPEEADISRFSKESGVLPFIKSPIFRGFCYIPFSDNLTIYGNSDICPFTVNLLFIPLPNRTQSIKNMRSNNAVNRAMALVIFNPRLVDGISVVNNLYLHPFVCSISISGGAYSDTIVSSMSKLKFKAEDKISILFYSI